MVVIILGHDCFHKKSFQFVVYQSTSYVLVTCNQRLYFTLYFVSPKSRDGSETCLCSFWSYPNRTTYGFTSSCTQHKGSHLTAILTMVPSISWHYVTCCTWGYQVAKFCWELSWGPWLLQIRIRSTWGCSRSTPAQDTPRQSVTARVSTFTVHRWCLSEQTVRKHVYSVILLYGIRVDGDRISCKYY